MSNEAAERLRQEAYLDYVHDKHGEPFSLQLAEVLAAERKATVERLRQAIPIEELDECVGIDRYEAVEGVKWSTLEKYLDAEAAR